MTGISALMLIEIEGLLKIARNFNFNIPCYCVTNTSFTFYTSKCDWNFNVIALASGFNKRFILLFNSSVIAVL